LRFEPSKRPDLRQHFLKASSRIAGTQIVAAKFLQQLFVVVYDSVTAFDAGFGGESFAALATALERRRCRRVDR
jgi:hypothetical protein